MIGKKIVELLEENNMTQKDLAKKIGVTAVTISRYVTGERMPQSDIIVKIAETFNVSTDHLLGIPAKHKSTTPQQLHPEIVSLMRARERMTPEQFAKWMRVSREIFPEAFESED